VKLHNASPFTANTPTANPTSAFALTKAPLHTNLSANTNGLSMTALFLIQQTLHTGRCKVFLVPYVNNQCKWIRYHLLNGLLESVPLGRVTVASFAYTLQAFGPSTYSALHSRTLSCWRYRRKAGSKRMALVSTCQHQCAAYSTRYGFSTLCETGKWTDYKKKEEQIEN